MKISNILLAPLAALSLAAPAVAQVSSDAAAADRIRGHVEFLSSDLLEGRATGSRGHEIAAAYVAGDFRKLGLQPGGDQGSWYVQVPFRRASHAGVPTLRLVKDGRAVDLTSGADFALRPSLTEKDRSIDAGLVFVGHGISDSSLGIDEYAGQDVRGKIVVALQGAPAGIPSDVAAHLEWAKKSVAASKGAVGFIQIDAREPQSGHGDLDQVSGPVLSWVDSGGRAGSAAAVRATLALSPQWATRLFEGAKSSLSAIRSRAGKGAIAGFPLLGQMQIRGASEWEDFTSPEVIAVLPGADPALAGEYVILTAHLDHVGMNPAAPAGADGIFNGAIDNAGGIATMLEAARSFMLAGERPRRSIMFVAHTGEEKGLLGADYLAANPTIPAARLAGLVNLDMPLLLYDFTDVIAFGGEHSTIDRHVASAAASMGIAVSPDPMPEQTLFVRSDHYPFVRQGVPSVFLMTGYANGGKQAWTDFLGNVYHRPNDDLSQAIDWRAGARFAELNFRIARAMANAPEAPRWYQDSYFGTAFAPGKAKAQR